jgi:hypothetical protein
MVCRNVPGASRGTTSAEGDLVRRPVLLVLFAAVTLVVAACSSAPDDSSSAAGAAGPLDGTFSQESSSGSTPFTSITFLDDSHYSYIESNCAAMTQAADRTGDDDDDDDAGTGGAAPEACVHEGTYTATPTDLALTDDGQSATIHVALGADADATSATTTTESLRPETLTGTAPSLVFSSKVNAFQANGTSMKHVDSSSTVDPVVTASAIAAGRQWIDVKMPYCQAANNAYDSTCGRTCRRTGAANTAQWNRYRSDCSGFVSWSWNLPAPGQTTATLPSVSRYIPAVDLQPGDALDRPGHHVVMFERWANSAKTSAVIMEEPRCGQVAKEITISFRAGSSPGVHWEGGTFFAMRKRGGLTN